MIETTPDDPGPPAIEIQGRPIGPGNPVFIVAELSANHRQDRDRAHRLVECAAEAGADAVKLQTYTPETMTIRSDKEPFRIGEGSLWGGKTLYELYEEAQTPWEWHSELKNQAHDLGVELFSTPFDHSAVDFLEEMGVPAYKIASFELVDHPLLRRVAETGKPVIMSTGMATLAEIDEAVGVLRDHGVDQLALMKCTSAYPAPPEEAHLRTIPHLAETFSVPVGLSDHTLAHEVPVASVALGACLIEKHLTLSREGDGPDDAFSLEPDEFARMVESVRVVEGALGSVHYGLTDRQIESRSYRRSLFVVADVQEGEEFTPRNVRSIRPSDGLAPKHLHNVIGRRAAEAIEAGTPLTWTLIR